MVTPCCCCCSQPNIPIQYGADARLLGDWRLIYASSGEEYSTPEPATSLFAQALALLERVPGVSMACVQQRLERDLSSSMDHLTHPWAPLPAGMSMGEASGRGVSQTQPNASAEHGQGVTATGGVGAAARPGNHRSVVRTVNSAEFAFGPFGRWRISVEGRWVDAGDGASAEVREGLALGLKFADFMCVGVGPRACIDGVSCPLSL